MRILFTYENLLPNDEADSEQFINTAASLSRRGHDVEMIVPRDPSRSLTARDVLEHYQVEGDIKLTQIKGATQHLYLQHVVHALSVGRGLARNDFDILYTRNLGTLSAALLRGAPCIYEHFRPWGDQFPPMQPWLRAVMRAENFLGAMFHSDLARESYERLDIPKERLAVVHNGFEPDRMEPRLSREEARRQLGLPLDRSVVTYTGRVNHKKGLDVVLDMAKRFDPETGPIFVLVGSTGDGPIERAAAEIPNVQIEPWQRFADAARFLYAADALLVPPSLDPLTRFGSTVLPIKTFIYLAAGRAIFAPRAPDTKDLLRHDDTAWLVTPDAPAEAAEQLRVLLADEATRDRLAANCLALSQTLTWDARAETIERYLEARLAARGRFPSAGGAWRAREWLKETTDWARRGLTSGKWVATGA